jgi:hypothetical protein
MNTDQDISIVIAASVRYALGRSSYLVSVVQDFLRRHLDNKFIQRDLKLYQRDIKKHLEISEGENTFIRQSWEKLLDELNEVKTEPETATEQ